MANCKESSAGTHNPQLAELPGLFKEETELLIKLTEIRGR
jgi:hypothetical protein